MHDCGVGIVNAQAGVCGLPDSDLHIDAIGDIQAKEAGHALEVGVDNHLVIIDPHRLRWAADGGKPEFGREIEAFGAGFNLPVAMM